MRVILAQGSCPVLQILDVSSQRGKTGTMLLFFQQKQYVRVILAPDPCNFHCIVIKKLQKRVAPIVLLCRLEKTCHIFPPIPTFSNYACHPCTGVMPSASNP